MEKQAEVEAELRKVVDNMMREELEVLQAALDRDRYCNGSQKMIIYQAQHNVLYAKYHVYIY